MPSVPPAVMQPAESAPSYLVFTMIGLAMMPSTVTAAPTMPVAMAKIVAVRMTTAKSAPRIGARMFLSAMNSRSISPACSVR